MIKKPDKLDEQFEETWASVAEVWKHGSKDDAKYFWLLGCKAANDKVITSFSETRKAIEEATDAVCE